jgi:hypothetical protein
MNKLAPFTLALALVSCETPLRSAAATAQAAPRLPNALVGNWCFHKPYDNDPDPYIMWPDAKDFDECANRGGALARLRVRSRGGTPNLF